MNTNEAFYFTMGAVFVVLVWLLFFKKPGRRTSTQRQIAMIAELGMSTRRSTVRQTRGTNICTGRALTRDSEDAALRQIQVEGREVEAPATSFGGLHYSPPPTPPPPTYEETVEAIAAAKMAEQGTDVATTVA